jgi:hypothetical protein
MWQREYGFQGIDMGYSILEAPGGGYLIGGRATISDDDFYLLSTDWNGLTSIPESFPGSNEKITVYPNPFNDFFMISSANAFNNIRLFDTMGKVVTEISEGNVSFMRLDLQFLPPGIYFSEIRFGDGRTARLPIVKN